MQVALVVLELMRFKVCGIIGISKINFLNFSGSERINIDQRLSSNTLTNLMQMFSFDTSLKTSKNKRFSDVFRGCNKKRKLT